MTLLPVSSCNSVDGAPAQCPGGHGFDSSQRLKSIFSAPCMLVGMMVVTTYLYTQAQPSQTWWSTFINTFFTPRNVYSTVLDIHQESNKYVTIEIYNKIN